MMGAAGVASPASYYDSPPTLTSPASLVHGFSSHSSLVGQTQGPGNPLSQYSQMSAKLTFHWFFRKDVDGKITWKPFSILDSEALEEAFITSM